MIVQDIYISKYKWKVRIYYAFNVDYIDKVLDDLIDIECPVEVLLNVEDLFSGNPFNRGFTFSNMELKSSVIIIGRTSSADEFQNTFDHEKGHLAMHICDYYNIDPFSEEYQYLTGNIGSQMFPIAKIFLCETCKKYYS